MIQIKMQVYTLHENLGPPLQHKQEISDTARCLETVFYIRTFYV